MTSASEPLELDSFSSSSELTSAATSSESEATTLDAVAGVGGEALTLGTGDEGVEPHADDGALAEGGLDEELDAGDEAMDDVALDGELPRAACCELTIASTPSEGKSVDSIPSEVSRVDERSSASRFESNASAHGLV